MANYVGVDWASGCWVVVEFGESADVSTEPSILNVWNQHEGANCILVDIPIGLESDGPRDCDIAARTRLSERSSTVYLTPTSKAVAERNYHRAKRKNKSTKGLGSQAWWLIPRIREVDAFLERFPDADDKVHESHPEVCFAVLNNGGDALQSKNSDAGHEQRLNILKSNQLGSDEREFGRQIGDYVERRREEADWHHGIQTGRLDDVVDAAVLALTAKIADENDYPTLPEDRGIDNPPVIVHPGRS